MVWGSNRLTDRTRYRFTTNPFGPATSGCKSLYLDQSCRILVSLLTREKRERTWEKAKNSVTDLSSNPQIFI